MLFRSFYVNFYALNKDGIHGGATVGNSTSRSGRRPSYAVHDGVEAKLVPLTPLEPAAN